MRGFHKRITTLQGEYVQNFERARTRFFAMTMFFSLAFLIIAGRLAYLMVPGILAGDLNTADAAISAPAPKRANIVDRNGMVIATSLKAYSLYADPKFVVNPEKLAQKLVKIFPDLDAAALADDLKKDRRFTWIKRHLTPKQHVAVLEIGDPALNVETEYQRVYPQDRLFSHLIGYTNVDGHGIAGLEKQYDGELVGQQDDLQLTVDTTLQDILRSEIQKSIDEFSGIGGAGIVMDVHSGEIMAMVSLPDFDPNNPDTNNSETMFNRNTVGVYEMGSTFKTFTVAAALEEKATRVGQMYDVSEPLKYGRFRIRDYHPFKRPISATEVFIHSSNIGTAQMALDLGTEKLKQFYKDLGFFSKINVDLPERGVPLVPSPWGEIHTVTASYGHGIAVTPLHVVRATAAMVNGGNLPYPHLYRDSETLKAPRVSVISPETSNLVSGLLALTVEKGTGSKAAHSDVWVGGKTGTSEKISAQGGYQRKKLLSSFVGVFPADDPQYVVLVSIDEPKGTKKSFGYATGGWTSAPVVGKVVEYMKPAIPALNDADKKPFPALTALEKFVTEDED